LKQWSLEYNKNKRKKKIKRVVIPRRRRKIRFININEQKTIQENKIRRKEEFRMKLEKQRSKKMSRIITEWKVIQQKRMELIKIEEQNELQNRTEVTTSSSSEFSEYDDENE
jgi:hypothetical protein